MWAKRKCEERHNKVPFWFDYFLCIDNYSYLMLVKMAVACHQTVAG